MQIKELNKSEKFLNINIVNVVENNNDNKSIKTKIIILTLLFKSAINLSKLQI